MIWPPFTRQPVKAEHIRISSHFIHIICKLAFEVCRQHSANYFFQFASGKVWTFVEC